MTTAAPAPSPAAPVVDLRLAALRRFAMAISVLTLVGHTVLGFEPSWAQLLTSLATAYTVELGLESLDAWATGRRPGFLGGGLRGFVDFLLAAHITGAAVAMLFFAGPRLLAVVFAATVGITSKAIFRAPVGRGWRHFLNPSNTGVAVSLALFPSLGITPPYQFLEGLSGPWDGVVPSVVFCLGTFLNAKFTKRIPLVLGWLGGFVLQAVVRALVFDARLATALMPMTGVAFILYTFYMVTDPGTTPSLPRRQVAFGLAVAGVYGALQLLHVAFGLFFALLIVCTARGVGLNVLAWRASRAAVPAPAPVAVGAGDR